MLDHGKDCLLINGGQNVKLEKGFIEFKNYPRQIPVHFKSYADFECSLKNVGCGVNNYCFSYTKKYKDHVPCSFAYKVVCVNNKFSKMFFCTEKKMQFINLFSGFLKSILIAGE